MSRSCDRRRASTRSRTASSTAVAVGEYLPGARLPPERELAGLLGVARVTVRGALARLVERGLLETRRGRGGGTFVRTEWPDSSSRRRRAGAARPVGGDPGHRRRHRAAARGARDGRRGTGTPDDAALIRARLEAFRDATSGLAKQQADAVLHRDDHRRRAERRPARRRSSGWRRGSPSPLRRTSGVRPTGMAEMETRALARARGARGRGRVRGGHAEAGVIARQHVGIDVELLERAVRRTGQVPRH